MFLWVFSKNFWERFRLTLIEALYKPTSFRYNFGFGPQDVKNVCKYYQEEKTRTALKKILDDNSLIGKNDYYTVLKVMKFFYKNYNPLYYYSSDDGERWNHPLETWQALNEKKSNLKPSYRTDCDDYSILMYNMLLVAGVKKDDLFLCFMKTEKEWHLNIMFFWKDVPYVVEGTYNPSLAIKNLGSVEYFQNYIVRDGKKIYYYEYVRYLFNEDKFYINNNKLNSLLMR